MGIADVRRSEQLDFLKSGKEIEVGDVNDLPLDIEVLMEINENSQYVENILI